MTIFLILYPPFENSTTRIAIVHSVEEKLESEPETVHVILLPTHCTIAILGTMGQTTHTRLKVIHRSKTTTIFLAAK